MKVATTVFVGNISERSSDTLLRQILLVGVHCSRDMGYSMCRVYACTMYDCVVVSSSQRCGRIEGWKRVQDASGKLQGQLPKL